MKIGARLVTGFALITVFTATIGVLSIDSLKRLKAADGVLYNRVTMPVGNLARITESFQRMRVNSRDYLTAQSSQERAAIHATLKELSATISEQAALYDKGLTTDKGHQLYTNFTESHKPYLALQEKVLALADAGKTREAEDLLEGEGKRVALAEQEAINALLVFKISLADTVYNQNVALARSTSLLISVVLVAAVIAAMALGITLSRSITKPLGVGVELAEAVAKGDLSRTVPDRFLSRKDEIGNLARAIDEMIHSLESVALVIREGARTVAAGSEQINSTSSR